MLSEREARELLVSGSIQFQPLELAFIASNQGPADWLLNISFGGQTKTFAVEYSRFSTPLSLSQAMSQVRRASTRTGNDAVLPLVMAPYLDAESIDHLLDEGVSGIDLSGNGVIYIPGEWFILRTGAPNQYPTSRPIKKIYEGKSSLVGRVVLLEREFQTVGDVYEAISRRGGEIALSTVSKVLSALEEELLIAKEPFIRLLQPDRLLENLREGFRQPEAESVLLGKSQLAADELLQTLATWAEAKGVSLAADGSDRYVLMPSSRATKRVYVSRLDDVSSVAGLDLDSPFRNLEVISTVDPTVFFDLQVEDGVAWTSPLQVYLQLSTGGKREQQTAEQLRNQLLWQAPVK